MISIQKRVLKCQQFTYTPITNTHITHGIHFLFRSILTCNERQPVHALEPSGYSGPGRRGPGWHKTQGDLVPARCRSGTVALLVLQTAGKSD